jgi:hypothetical protein
MKLRQKALGAAAAAMVVGSLSFGAAAPASAINRAYPCNSGDTGDFLEFYSNASTCWANRGDVNVGLYSVTDAYSGNNAGAFYDSTDNSTWFFAKWTHMPLNSDWAPPGKTVTWICISPDDPYC